MKEKLSNLKNDVMTGISYMIPTCIIGGIFFALSVSFGGKATEGQGMVINSQIWKDVQTIGNAGLMIMIVMLCMYIAYGIAGKPALAPAAVAGYIANIEVGANSVKSGFLGAMLMGLLIGYLTKYLKKVKYPQVIKSIVPIFIIPLVDALVILLYIEVLATPLGMALNWISTMMDGLTGQSLVVAAIIIACMITVDMGGPINKTCCIFLLAAMGAGHMEYMAMFGVAACTPPLGLGLATLISKKKFTPEEQIAGKTALFMGFGGITEGAIPFAAADPIRVIPSIMIGGSAGAIIAAIGKSINYAPHGGLIVLPAVQSKLPYVIGILVGTLITSALVLLTKKQIPEDE